VAKVCEICGKIPTYGHKVSHSHKSTNRRWEPNLQNIKIMLNGEKIKAKVCTSCIRSGKIQKAL
jgi:large subunit ribosomal protein L28